MNSKDMRYNSFWCLFVMVVSMVIAVATETDTSMTSATFFIAAIIFAVCESIMKELERIDKQ